VATVGCDCKQRADDETEDEVFRLLESVDLRYVAEQASALPATTARAIRQLEKSERAERLELGADVVALFRSAAEWDRAQSIREVRAAIACLDERTGRDDWSDLADRATREFNERDGAALVEELRGRFRLAALEMDGISADDAAAVVGVFEESLDRIQADGLDGGANLLRERLGRALEAIQSTNWGRGLASPLTTGQIACIGIFSAMATIMMILCGITPFCWCCRGAPIIVWLVLMLTGCLVAPAL
jgi:hypothetical protein